MAPIFIYFQIIKQSQKKLLISVICHFVVAHLPLSGQSVTESYVHSVKVQNIFVQLYCDQVQVKTLVSLFLLE